mmetsp:Transcript_120421/g.257101  ORF Transcript_120421/g.257101 Transcript_120421/m.257101 type:complete len:143 (+) Transcript_120421:71-499(+)
MAPADLIWECVKQHNSFIRKSPNMPTMSAEPGNLCGLNSFKYSGLASQKVLDVSSTTKGKKESIMLTVRSKVGSKAQRPKLALVKTALRKDTKKGLATLAKTMDAGFYRKDLLALANAKYAKVKTSFKKRKVAVKSRRAPKK